jgi:hypothetical protein
MPRIHLVYSNSKLPLSPLIRWRTGSEFSHVGIILENDDNEINELSIVSHSALSCKGVRFTTLKTFLSHAIEYRITQLEQEVTQEQFDMLLYLCRKYEGLKYDLKGAVGLGVGEDWQEDDAFWCSEWVAFLLNMIGVKLAYLDDVHRIAPKHNLEWPQKTLNISLTNLSNEVD